MRHPCRLLAALAAFVLAGCAGPTPTQTSGGSLRIDGRTPAAIVSPAEAQRIRKAIPARYQGKVLAAEALGRVIYEHATLAEDAAQRLSPDWSDTFPQPPVGWLVERTASGLHVLFLIKADDRLRIAALASRGGAGNKLHVVRPGTPRALTPQQLVLWQARQLAFSRKFRPCSTRYDPAVIPVHAGGADQIGVYLLPESSDPKRLFLGGYRVVTINADGDEILHTHAFTHSCASLERTPGAVAAAVTETRSDSPTAPQVYASLRYGLPVRVTTKGNALVWTVESGRIVLKGPAGKQ